MEFIYVNRNKLIPSVKKYSNLDIGLEKIMRKTLNNNFDINNNILSNNVYLVEFYNNIQTSIYFYNQENIFKYSDNNLQIVQKNILLNSFNNTFSDINSLINSNINNSSISTSKINDKNKTVVKNDDKNKSIDKEENEEKIRKKKELRELCDQVIESYNLEKENMKKLGLSLKKLEKDEQNLIKKIRSKNIDNLSTLFYDLNSYNKILEKINKEEKPLEEDDERIPILFIKKFKYLKKFLQKYGNLCELLLTIDLNKLINSDIDEKVIDFSDEKLNEIFLIAKIYNKDYKTLNVEFSHSWEELDHDIEGNRLAP